MSDFDTKQWFESQRSNFQRVIDERRWHDAYAITEQLRLMDISYPLDQFVQMCCKSCGSEMTEELASLYESRDEAIRQEYVSTEVEITRLDDINEVFINMNGRERIGECLFTKHRNQLQHDIANAMAVPSHLMGKHNE